MTLPRSDEQEERTIVLQMCVGVHHKAAGAAGHMMVPHEYTHSPCVDVHRHPREPHQAVDWPRGHCWRIGPRRRCIQRRSLLMMCAGPSQTRGQAVGHHSHVSAASLFLCVSVVKAGKKWEDDETELLVKLLSEGREHQEIADALTTSSAR
ncbi:hypothetical protein DM02DRAFT_665319 [Periconia macrospinosa]|uniref:Uncharacterized protein n=1 Tax=Periconia macrospinosa TaxID=97972 RepID=A0A2V1CWZ2_9PLEO|nr:hypothetical protein DM02DRAFT_665319 [Periconia macrospinosa]